MTSKSERHTPTMPINIRPMDAQAVAEFGLAQLDEERLNRLQGMAEETAYVELPPQHLEDSRLHDVVQGLKNAMSLDRSFDT